MNIHILAYFFIMLFYYSTVFLENVKTIVISTAPSNHPYLKLSKTVYYWSMFQVSAAMMISAGH